MSRYKWTPEKINLLSRYYPNTPWDELFEILGNRSKTSIVSMASKNGISRDIYNKCHFTMEEQNFIKQNARYLDVSAIARYLGRTNGAITQWAQEHNVDYFFCHGLRKEDEPRFKELYPFYTNKYLHEHFFPYLSSSQLRTQARKFGLVKNKEKGVRWYDKEQILADLKQVCVQLKRTPMLIELSTYGLPSEKTFTRYFGSLTDALALIGIERTSYALNLCGQQLEKDCCGNVCLSRSEICVGNFLHSLGYIYEKECSY